MFLRLFIIFSWICQFAKNCRMPCRNGCRMAVAFSSLSNVCRREKTNFVRPGWAMGCWRPWRIIMINVTGIANSACSCPIISTLSWLSRVSQAWKHSSRIGKNMWQPSSEWNGSVIFLITVCETTTRFMKKLHTFSWIPSAKVYVSEWRIGSGFIAPTTDHRRFWWCNRKQPLALTGTPPRLPKQAVGCTATRYR